MEISEEEYMLFPTQNIWNSKLKHCLFSISKGSLEIIMTKWKGWLPGNKTG